MGGCNRIKPLECCLAQTGGVPKYDEVVYGEHLLSKVLGNFVTGAPTYASTYAASRHGACKC